MAFYAGKAASVTIAASARPMDTWSIDLKCEPVDSTNFTSGGYTENVAGLFSADVSFGGPYDDAEGVQKGDSVSVIFGIGGGGQSFTIVTRITSAKVSTDVKGLARIDYTGVSNGSFSITL